MFRIYLSFIAVIVVSAAAVSAQNAPDTLYSLPEVTIVATRFPLPVNALPARVTTIDRADIERYVDRSLGEALEQSGAGFIRRYGQGGLAGISLRGAGPSQTAVLLDGQRLSDPQLGQVDLSLFPTMFISSVEVLHGGGSSRFGSDAVAGAINIATRDADRTALSVTTGVGAFGERSIGVGGTFEGDRIDALVAAELSREDGDFPFVDKSSFPERTRERSNADRRSFSVFAKLRRSRDFSATEVSGWLLSAERGLPPVAGAASTGERQWDDLVRLWLTQQWTDANGVTELQGSVQRASIRYANPAIDVNDKGTTVTVSGGASREQFVGRTFRVRAGTDLSLQTADHPALGSGVSQVGVAVHVTGSLSLGGRGSVFPSARSDWLVRDESVTHSFNPSLRFRFRPGIGGGWALKGGIERSFRFPTFNDLYWRGAGASGNRELVPESGISTDVGLSVSSGRLSAEITTFLQSIRNRITWLPDRSGVWTPRNIGRTESRGLEIAAARHLVWDAAELTLSTGYDLVYARDRSEQDSESYGMPLRYVPEHVFRAGLKANAGGLSAGLSGRFVGRRYITADASSWLDPYLVLDASLGSRLDLGTASFDLIVALENLGATEYQVVSGYPMPSRHLRVRLKATL